MKNLLPLILIIMTISCSTDSPEENQQQGPPQPKKTLVKIAWNHIPGNKLILRDLNHADPDTIATIENDEAEIELLDRGYYEIILKTETAQIFNISLSRENGHIKAYNSLLPVTGATMQFFNRTP